MIEAIITSSVLILAIVVIRYLLRGKISPRVQYALWGLVAIRLLLPVALLPSVVSIMNLVDVGKVQSAAPNAYIPPEEASYVIDSPMVQPALTSSDISTVTAPLPPTARETVMSTTVILTIVWLCGTGLVASSMTAVNISFRKKIKKSSVPLEITDAGLPVYLVEGLLSPCLFGVIHPKIYLTHESVSSDERLRFILAHELTHYAHKDYLWSYLRCLCIAIYWFNPLVWLAAALSRRDCELACDEGTLKQIGENRRTEYGRMLISMVAAVKRPSDILCSATTMTSGKGGIKERINLIVRKPKMLASTMIIVVLIVAVMVGCTFTGATPTASTNPDASTTPSADSAPSPEVTPTVLTSATPSQSNSYGDDATTYVGSGSSVLDFAQNFITYVSMHFQEDAQYEKSVKIIETKLKSLERIAQFDDMADYPIELWSLRYHLKPDNIDNVIFAGGMSEEDGWITESGSTGGPCLIVARKNGINGIATYLGCTNDLAIMEEGGAENALRIFMEINGLLPAETYPGNHATVRFPLSDGAVYKAILSQPVKQGEDGIWCVERIYSPQGGVSLVSPNRDGLAMDTYRQVQADCDSGKNTELLDPAQAALVYINNVMGQTATIDNLEISSGIDVLRSADLETSVSDAIIENNRTIGGGEFKTEAHTVLKIVEDQYAYSVYSIVFYAEYNFSNGNPQLVKSMQLPVRLTYSKDSSGAYRITSYTDFQEGDTFLRSIFPSEIPDFALDIKQYPEQQNECLQKAEAYMAAKS